ncbi:hypothetical protein [Peribacillus simplex]|nr:hypothetical protein [Peribacillus simplex]
MSLLNMTFRNVQRNFRVYTIYLFAMITGVMVHPFQPTFLTFR